MLVHDYWRGVNLTACPVSSEGSSGGSPLTHHISTAAIYLLWGTLALGFASATVVKFNSVFLYDRNHRVPAISNSLWIVFFFVASTHGFLSGFRYLFTIDDAAHTLPDTILFLGASLCEGFAGAVLVMALNYQRVHRSQEDGAVSVQAGRHPAARARLKRPGSLGSRAALEVDGANDDDDDDDATLLDPNRDPNHSVSSDRGAGALRDHDDERLPLLRPASPGFRLWSVETLTGLLFLVYSAAVLLQVLGQDHALIFWLCMGTVWVQAILQVTLAVAILTAQREFGVTRRAKVVLAIATILTNINILPPTVWQSFLPRTCVFYVASWVDFLLLFDTGSLVLFFVFLRLEFWRNREAAVFSTVSQIADAHGYKSKFATKK